MLHVLGTLLRKLVGYRYQRNIERALALHLRSEVRSDGLKPVNSTTHLEIEWRARDIHPWDRSLLSPTQRGAAFVKQSLADTEAAIHRLFEALPQIDVINLRVFDRTSETLIITGTVARPVTSGRDEKLSIGMRLRYLGITYHSAGSLFEALEGDHQTAPAPNVGGVPSFGAEGSFVRPIYRHNLPTS
jgi:hypothetical protein